MKDELNRKEIPKGILNGFDVCLKGRVDWVSKYGEMGEKHTFWALFGDLYRYKLNLYRYNFGSGHF